VLLHCTFLAGDDPKQEKRKAPEKGACGLGRDAGNVEQGLRSFLREETPCEAPAWREGAIEGVSPLHPVIRQRAAFQREAGLGPDRQAEGRALA
jgi:hypothetical protein